MALSIATNIASLTAQVNLNKNQKNLQTSINRLSSGLRVNTAADDAAGLAVSESMKAQIRSYTVAGRNAGDGVSMAQTAEGALGQVHDILGRMRELATQAANGSLSDTDRGYLDKEYQQDSQEITRLQSATSFNGVSLIGSGAATTTSFQVGLNNTAGVDTIDVGFNGIDLSAVTGADITSQANASALLAAGGGIDAAIATVSDARAGFGAAMNRLDYASANIDTMKLNLSAANSRIVDVDVADETSQLSKNQVLTQAGTSVLAQANQLPQMAFGLIGH
ncbi:MAG TPA: flagellin [Polyangiaceae bacterium]|nr:flagellin [Polyangiaceae bacterium]